MLGYWIVVTLQPLGDHVSPTSPERHVLAEWETGIGGIDWIEDLVKAGTATKHRTGGYPNEYTCPASVVIPLISSDAIKPSRAGPWVFGLDEGEEYAQPPGWMAKVNLKPEAIANCPADAVLTIAAWDQS